MFAKLNEKSEPPKRRSASYDYLLIIYNADKSTSCIKPED